MKKQLKIKGCDYERLLLTIVFISIAFVNFAVAVETEVIATVNGKTITNIDVFKEFERISSNMDFYCPSRCMEGVLDDIVTPLVFEQYTKKHKFPVTDQQIMEEMDKSARKRGLASAEEDFQKNRGKYDKEIKDWQGYKVTKGSLLQLRSVHHFDPSVLNVTEEDIQKYVEHYKKRYSYPMGHREGVEFRSITVRTDIINKDKSLLKELKKIKQKINKNETFEDVVKEYRDRKEFSIEDIPFGSSTRNLEISKIKKQGWDALIPWSRLKGKAVMVSFADAARGVIIVDDYVPDTRMDIEDAVNDKEFRKKVIEGAKGLKYRNARRRFLKKQKAETVTFAGNEQEVYQKLADQYESWWIDTFKAAPDFQKRLGDLKSSKEKYIKRQIERARKQKK